jgi:integrase
MAMIRLIKSEIDRLPLPTCGQRIEYFDTDLSGFGLRVTENKKTYFVMSRVNGKLTRVTIGQHGVFTPEKARKAAAGILVELRKGTDINREKAKARDRGETLRDTLEKYFQVKNDLRPNTVSTYNGLMKNHLSDWLDKPMSEITKDMVSKRHLKLADKIGRAQANNTMRTFRLLYNFAYALNDGDMPENPVQRLSHIKQWFHIDRRRTLLREHEIKTWINAVREIGNPVTRDYLQFVLFTGLREREALLLRWEDVCFEDRTFTIRKESAKNKRECILPMSEFVFGLLQQRLAMRENDFVFPGIGKTGHLVEVHRQLKSIEDKTAIKTEAGIIEKSGIKASLHDLRRTFASIAESETSYIAVKTLLNHAVSADVTQGYIQVPMADLRKAVEKISHRMLKAIKGETAKGKVIPLIQ